MTKNTVTIVCALIGATALIGAAFIGLSKKDHPEIKIVLPEAGLPAPKLPEPKLQPKPMAKKAMERLPDPRQLKDKLRGADNYFTAQRYVEASNAYKEITKLVSLNGDESALSEEAEYVLGTNPEKACIIYRELFQRFRQPNTRWGGIK